MLEQLFEQLPNSGFGHSVNEASLESLLGLGDENQLQKALGTTGALGSDASPMIGESLDNMVKLITLDPRSFAVLLQRLEAYDAKAISEEYNRVSSLGLSDSSFSREGQLGVNDSPTYERLTEEIRHVSQTSAVSDTAQRAVAYKFGDLKAQAVNLRLKKMLLDIDRDIIHGNSSLNPLSWRGLIQQVTDRVGKTSQVYTDMVKFNGTTGTTGSGRTTYIKGGSMSSELIREKAELPLNLGGLPTCIYLSPKDKRIIGEAENAATRYMQADQVSRIAKGMRVDQINTDFGADTGIDIVWDLFMRYRRGRLSSKPKDPTTGKFHKQVPDQLPSGAFSVVAVAPSPEPGFLPVDVYYYGIAPIGGPGEGKIRMLNTGVTTSDVNGTARITLNLPADLSNIKSWALYRSTIDGADAGNFRFLKEVALDTSAGNGTQVIDDDGSIIPSSRYAFMQDESKSALAFLLYPTVFDLAKVDLTERFTVASEMLVQLYAPEYAHVFENVGGHYDTLLDPDS